MNLAQGWFSETPQANSQQKWVTDARRLLNIAKQQQLCAKILPRNC